MLKQFMRSLGKLLLAGLALYLLPLLYLYFNQNNIIYQPGHPGREVSVTPAKLDIPFESITLTAEDGVRLDGWYLPAEDARATLLFFHGNAGNISHRLSSLELFHQLGLSVLIIDYRGYGRSEGEPSETGIYRDADAAWRYLTETRKIPPGQILLLGRSFGGAVVAYLASRHETLGLILESTFTSAPEMAAALYPWIPARWLSRSSYDTRQRLAAIHQPLMIIHSRDDDLIPFSQGEALYAAGNPPKRLLELNGNHNNGVLENAARYRRGLDEFIRFCLSKT